MAHKEQDSEVAQRSVLNVVQGYRITFAGPGKYVIEALDNDGAYIKDVSVWSRYELAYDKLAVFLLMTDGQGVSEEATQARLRHVGMD